jgi:HEAT repeat protein
MSLLKEEKIESAEGAVVGSVETTATDPSLNIDFTASKTQVRERNQEGHEGLIADLSSALDPRDRTFAAMSLGYLGDPKVIPALEMAILTRSENIFVLEAALRSISQYGESAAHSHLSVARLVNHDSPIVRLAAIQALDSFKLESHTLLSIISGRLIDPAVTVRREVARILSDLPSEQLRDVLPRATHLLEIGEGDRRLVFDLLKIVEKAGRESPEATSAVRLRLRDCEVDVRIKAAEALSRMGSHVKIAGWDLYSIVINALENITLRRESAIALRVHRHFEEEILMDLGRVIEEEILENNKDKIKEVLSLKREVIDLIGDFGPRAQKAAPYLREALKSEESVLISAAADALARLEAFEVLIDALNSTDILVMQCITDAIKGMVHKLKHSKRVRLVALLKLKFAWVKEARLLDSIMALLRTLEAIDQAERQNNPEALQAPIDFSIPLQA